MRHTSYSAIGCRYAVFALCVACSGEQEPTDIRAHIDEHADLIRLESPEPVAVIESPVEVTGRARGSWSAGLSRPPARSAARRWNARSLEGWREFVEDGSLVGEVRMTTVVAKP